MKRCANTLIARNMKIKVTDITLFSSTWQNLNIAARNAEKRVLSYIVAGYVKVTAFLENNLTTSIKITTTQTVS